MPWSVSNKPQCQGSLLMFERLRAPILACCNSLLSAVFCAWLPFTVHCLANCLRHSAKCAKDVKLWSFCKPEGHRFKVKWTWNLWQSNPISKKGVPKYRLLCHFAFNPRLPPPCAVRCPGEVLYFAKFFFSVSRISLRSVSSRFCWILKTLHSCTKFLIHWDIELKQGNYTVDTETAISWFSGSAACVFLFCLSNTQILWFNAVEANPQLRRVNGWGHVGFHDCHCLAWMWFLPSI